RNRCGYSHAGSGEKNGRARPEGEWRRPHSRRDRTALVAEGIHRLIRPERLGSASFRETHGVRYAYIAGSMYKGIASKELVVRMARAGLLGYLGAGGMKFDRLSSDLVYIRENVPAGASYGANLLCNLIYPEAEE